MDLLFMLRFEFSEDWSKNYYFQLISSWRSLQPISHQKGPIFNFAGADYLNSKRFIISFERKQYLSKNIS